MNINQIKGAIARFHGLLSHEPHRRLMLSTITSGGGGEWIPQCLLQMAFEETLGETHFVRREYGTTANANRARLDIACIGRDTRKVDVAIEMKAPWTNQDGIKHKMDRAEGISKDIRTLKSYAMDGTPIGIEVMLLVELFLKHEFDLYVPNARMRAGDFERLSVQLWEMKYPTRQDYDPARSQAFIDGHPVMIPLTSLTRWNRTDVGENEFGEAGIWDKFYRIKAG